MNLKGITDALYRRTVRREGWRCMCGSVWDRDSGSLRHGHASCPARRGCRLVKFRARVLARPGPPTPTRQLKRTSAARTLHTRVTSRLTGHSNLNSTGCRQRSTVTQSTRRNTTPHARHSHRRDPVRRGRLFSERSDSLLTRHCAATACARGLSHKHVAARCSFTDQIS